MFTRFFELLTGLVTFALLVSACAPAVTPLPTAQPDPEPESEPSALEGDLVIYTSRAESLFKPVLEAFEQANPGVEVTVLYGSNGELAAKILEEQENPQADVFVNSELLIIENLAEQGVFQPNSGAAVMAVPSQYRAADGSWVALTLRARVIMYNTNLVKPEEVPSSVFGLTDPKWKGQVGATDGTSGAMMANLVAMRQLVGEEKTEAFIKDLVANETRFFGGHTDVRKAVGAGELKLGFVNQYYYFLSLAEGAPVGIVWPDQAEGEMGLVVNTTNAGILKNAKHTELAQEFVEFMLSPAGQKVYAEKNFEYPVLENVPLAAGVPPLTDFRLASLDLKSFNGDLELITALVQKAGLP